MTVPSTMYYLVGVLVMAIVSCVPRVLPFILVRRKIQSRFIQSFLHYMPMAVLGAMTFPAILYATATPWSAVAGMLVALVMAYCRLPLLPVAIASTATVWITEWLMGVAF